MAKYAYEAITETGTTVAGVIEAASVEMATSLLADRGFIPAKVVPQKTGSSRGMSNWLDKLGGVKAPELILFTKQFRTLLRAGVPILSLLQVLENQTQNNTLKKIAASMALDIKEGATLYDAFKKYPRVFSHLYCSMVRAGEVSGALPEVLERLNYIIEHEHKIKSDIKGALQYPITVVIALGIAFFVLLTFVIPKFVTIFEASRIQLPLPTMICMSLHEFLAHYWYLCLGTVIGVVAGLHYYFKTEQGRHARDSFLLKIPIFGPLFIKAAMSRFASIFAILQASGVPVLDSFRVLAGTIGNAAISREFIKIREHIEEGRGIAGPLSGARYFTPMVINMVAVGEESGNLDEMLREVAVHYDDEVAYAVKGLSEAIGPILIVGLAGVVGFFALAIFLPMWDLTKMAK